MPELDCEKQQLSGFHPFMTGIRDRRFPIINREHGLVMSFAFFDHSDTMDDTHFTNGLAVQPALKTFLIRERFTVASGKIDQTEAVIETVPYKMRNDIWDRPE